MKRVQWIAIFAALFLVVFLGGCGKSSDFLNASGDVIGREEATAIALAHAEISQSKAYDLEVELDREWGILLYEVTFESGGLEYEYEIEARTGKLRSHRTKRDR